MKQERRARCMEMLHNSNEVTRWGFRLRDQVGAVGGLFFSPKRVISHKMS